RAALVPVRDPARGAPRVAPREMARREETRLTRALAGSLGTLRAWSFDGAERTVRVLAMIDGNPWPLIWSFLLVPWVVGALVYLAAGGGRRGRPRPPAGLARVLPFEPRRVRLSARAREPERERAS